jgi:hypothetical protein
MSIVPEDVDNEELERRFQRRRFADDYEERNTSADPWLSGVPAWVRAILAIGTTGAIAVYLVYILGNRVPKLEEHMVAIEKQQEGLRQAVADQTTKTDQVYRVLQRICSNAAKNEDDRQRCFDR